MTQTLAVVVLFQLAVPNTATMSYPVLGYTLNDGRLTRLTGVPGACTASPDPGNVRYLRIQTAPTARAALLSVSGDSPVLVYRTPVSDTNYTLAAVPAALALSPTGAYFAALSPNHLSIYRRTSGSPLATIPLSSLPVPPSDFIDLLVSDNGDLVLQTSAGFWFSSTPAAPATFTFVPAILTALRFAARDQLLVGYEEAQGRVIALHPRASFAVEPLLTGKDLTSPVTGLQFSADGTSIWVSQRVGAVINYDLPRRQAASYPLLFGAIGAPTAPGVFLWNQPDQQLAVLDTTQQGAPRVLLVPMVEPESLK